MADATNGPAPGIAEPSTSKPPDEDLLKVILGSSTLSVAMPCYILPCRFCAVQEFFSELREVDRDNEVNR